MLNKYTHMKVFSVLRKVPLLNCKMGEDDVSEMDRKKMEVRARLEQQSQAKKKKGFMTPERKKKLRVNHTFQFPDLVCIPFISVLCSFC